MYVAQQIFDFYYYFYTVYSVSIFTFYILLLLISIFHLRKYIQHNSFINYDVIVSSRFAPSISVLAPIYNEEENAVASIKSLINLHYVNFEIIVINDGSKDNTFQRIIEAFEMEKISTEIIINLPIKTIKGIYKSKLKAYSKLIFVDKENGGKSDALNTGLNISKSDYVLCIDGDCLIMEDALQKMIKPIISTSKMVIASGGIIRIANDCKVENGRLVHVNLAKKFIVKAQILEYIRSFLLARMAWSKLNGLMIISGAFGLLNRKIALLVGGYKTDTIGEDMEIIVRMQRYMAERKHDYEIKYIPDPLCWTEAPDNMKTLFRQRKRWAIGNIQTLRKHRKIFMNRKYGKLAFIGFPFWMIYERFGPLIEISGIVFFVIASYLGLVNWVYTVSFLIATYLFAITYSTFAIFIEETTYRQYKNRGDLRKLLLTVLIEPFTYHVFLLWPVLVGNIEVLFKKKISWGNMEKKGLESKNLPLQKKRQYPLTINVQN